MSALQYDSSSDDNDRGSQSVKKSLLAELTAARETTVDAAGDDSHDGRGQTSRRGTQKEKVRRRQGTGAAKNLASSKAAQREDNGGNGSGEDGQRPGRGARYVRKERGAKSRVVQNQEQPGGGAGASSGSEDGRRVRIKNNGLLGNASKAGVQKEQMVSESEFEPTMDEVENWRGSLNKLMDTDSEDVRTAFSIKECDPAVIRRLGPESFLGGRKLEEGGLPLYDGEGKANLHFVLGTYRSVRMIYSRRKRGDNTVEAVPDAERGLLRWLVLRARELQLISHQN